MIWQEKVTKVVMLTNLVETCKVRCSGYLSPKGYISVISFENIETMLGSFVLLSLASSQGLDKSAYTQSRQSLGC